MSHLERYPWPRGSEGAIYQLDTPIGKPFIRALSDRAISVQGGIPHNTTEGATGLLTINGVEYSVQSHWHRWSDGRFHAGMEDSRDSQMHEPHLSRRDWSGKDVTHAAWVKARDILETAVNAWAKTHLDDLTAGEARKRAEDAHRLARQLDKCETNCETLRANLAACESGGEYRAYPIDRR